jgi:lysophospholipase L1-like esterase
VGDFQNERGKKYYSVEALSDGMSQYNDKLIEVCKARGVEYIDLASRLPKDTTAFYDDAHFNESGAKMVAEAIFEYLRQRKPFAPQKEGQE